MRRYVLGQLPAAELAALEEGFFAQPERLEEVWAVENQLVDAYVRGQLGRAERDQFEQFYLDSPLHRERVAVARLLLKAADGAAFEAGTEPRLLSRWTAFWAALRTPHLAWGMAAVALLILLAGGLRFWRTAAELRAQLVAQQTAQQQREQELAAQIANARAQNEQLAAALAEAQRQPPSGQAQAVKPAAPTVFSFLLTGSLLRGSRAPQPLVIPRGSQQVELRMRLETAESTSYQADLRTVEGAFILSRRQLLPRAGRIVLTVPAAKLPVGDYILTLQGVQAGAAEEVNRYFFRVRSN